MDYVKLTVYTDIDSLELVADAMWRVVDQGVEIFEGNPIDTVRSTCGWDYIDEGSIYMQNEHPYCACIVQDKDVESAIDTILAVVNGEYGIGIAREDIKQTTIAQLDWENAWRDNYQVVTSGRFSIVPIWLHTGKKAKRTVLINPSTGFGTGQHESTAIALKLLDGMRLKDKTVLDIGTGSGILGIAAIKGGAMHAVMLDYDPAAIENAKENVRLNGVDDKSTLMVEDVIANDIAGAYNIVLANLTADILIAIANKIATVATKGSRVIVSGILSTRWADVSIVYRNLGFKVAKTSSIGEWTGAVLTI